MQRDLSIPRTALFSAETAPYPHMREQRPHEVQSDAFHVISRSLLWDSGLQHHIQRIGHPLKNTVVRIPGPS
jgi:hypothetical protein